MAVQPVGSYTLDNPVHVANHLLSLINDVLQMSKIEDGSETTVKVRNFFSVIIDSF